MRPSAPSMSVVRSMSIACLMAVSGWTVPAAVIAAQEPSFDGVIVQRAADTMLGSALGAIRVVTPGGETIGDVTDTVLSRDGRIVALVVGVGGFLGVAEKPVAIAWRHLEVRPLQDEGFEFVCDLDRTVLDAVPAYRDRDE